MFKNEKKKKSIILLICCIYCLALSYENHIHPCCSDKHFDHEIFYCHSNYSGQQIQGHSEKNGFHEHDHTDTHKHEPNLKTLPTKKLKHGFKKIAFSNKLFSIVLKSIHLNVYPTLFKFDFSPITNHLNKITILRI